MTPCIPVSLLSRPVAHRALHDLSSGRPENSRAAVKAAIDASYGIEIDIQVSSDGVAFVFHDHHLDRLTEKTGPVAGLSAKALSQITLRGADETIPTLVEILDLVAGQVPLLVEIKDQDGTLGPDVGVLERAVTRDLADYAGDVAVMSFNPHIMAAMQASLPDCPRGLTTEDFAAASGDWTASMTRLTELSGIPDVDRVGASFISHDHRQLGHPRVSELRSRGLPVLCWTIRSPEEEADARKMAQNITFEGYLPGGEA